MPIFVETDNSTEKLYKAGKAGEAATKVEEKMQAGIKKALKDLAGFTVTKSNGAKGYLILLELSEATPDGPDTKCTVKGEIVRYPKEMSSKKGAGNQMVSVGWHGSAKASGHRAGAIIDAVDAIVEAMMPNGIIAMNNDFLKRGIR